jgi:hypothetical protein
MNFYTQKAERLIKLFGQPDLPEHMKTCTATQRTSLKGVQSLKANNRTVTFGGIVYPLQYRHLGIGVYEFWFGITD